MRLGWRAHQDDHDGDEELEKVAQEEGLDGGVDPHAEGCLPHLSDGGLDHRLELRE
jgi:hypothetical protein